MKKKVYFCLSMVLVIALLLTCIGCGSKSATSKQADTMETAEIADSNKTFGLNETAVFDKINVTAKDLQESTGTQFFKPGEGKIFVGVQFEIENISNEDVSISSLLLFDVYADGVKCDYSTSAACTFSDGTLDGEVAAGKKLIGYYAVEVPQKWQELEFHVKDSWLSNTKAQFLFQK